MCPHERRLVWVWYEPGKINIKEGVGFLHVCEFASFHSFFGAVIVVSVYKHVSMYPPQLKKLTMY